MDEKTILRTRKEAAESVQTDIFTGEVCINKVRYEFVPTALFKSEIGMYLPKDFIPMPKAFAQQKYPNDGRPEEIRTSTDGSVNFGYYLYPGESRETDIPKLAFDIADTHKKVHSNYTFLEQKVQHYGENNSKLATWYDFISPTLNGNAYNLFMFVRVAEQVCHILFNCTEELCEEWKPIALQAMFTIRELKGGA